MLEPRWRWKPLRSQSNRHHRTHDAGKVETLAFLFWNKKQHYITLHYFTSQAVQFQNRKSVLLAEEQYILHFAIHTFVFSFCCTAAKAVLRFHAPSSCLNNKWLFSYARNGNTFGGKINHFFGERKDLFMKNNWQDWSCNMCLKPISYMSILQLTLKQHRFMKSWNINKNPLKFHNQSALFYYDS